MSLHVWIKVVERQPLEILCVESFCAGTCICNSLQTFVSG